MMYAGNAIIVNEFTCHSWKHISSNADVSLGTEVIKSIEFFSSAYWYWIGVWALLGMMILYFCFILALTYLKAIEKAQTVYQMMAVNEIDVPHPEIGTDDKNKRSQIILPFEPYSIAFDEEMNERGTIEDKFELLKSVSGAFRPGVGSLISHNTTKQQKIDMYMLCPMFYCQTRKRWRKQTKRKPPQNIKTTA